MGTPKLVCPKSEYWCQKQPVSTPAIPLEYHADINVKRHEAAVSNTNDEMKVYRITPIYATPITKTMHDLWPIDFTYVIQWGRVIKDMTPPQKWKNKKTQHNIGR